MLNFGCGLKPSVILSGSPALRIARVKRRIRSRWEIYFIPEVLLKIKVILYIQVKS
jgi:hypothetical protein